MLFNNKKILPSIENLSNLLNWSGNSVTLEVEIESDENIYPPKSIIESDIQLISDENIPAPKSIILSSQNPISLYVSSECQAVTTTKENCTSMEVSFSDAKIQTKPCNYRSYKSQTRNPAKKRVYSRKTQTDEQSVESIRESIQNAFPNSPLLSLNQNHFSRLVSGN